MGDPLLQNLIVAYAMAQSDEDSADILDEIATAMEKRSANPPNADRLAALAYRAGFLRRFPTLAVSQLEQIESLEQLRVLWHGERIAVHVSDERPGPGVDTPEDLARVRQLLQPV